MNILHINTCDILGGAARAAYRLHRGLRLTGQNSTMFVANKFSNDCNVIAFTPPSDLNSHLREFVIRNLSRAGQYLGLKYLPRIPGHYNGVLIDGYELFSSERSRYGNAVIEQLPRCDIINVHWIDNFLDYKSFFTLVPGNIPVVWTLHDMNAFTGGCHYDLGCGRFADKCGFCPQLCNQFSNDLSRKIWNHKKEIYSRIKPNQLHIVTPSHWLAREAHRSNLLKDFQVKVIPNGIDSDIYAPRNQEIIREALGIPLKAKVILFVAQDINIRRKGFYLLKKLMMNLTGLDELRLISIGKGNPDINCMSRHIHLGTIENERLLSAVYSAADLTVVTSIQDNLPNTVMESMACGTPVAGFNVGGIPDMIREGYTGLLIPVGDIDYMSEAVANLLKDGKRLKEMSFNCRKSAINKYDLKIQAESYLHLYNKIISG